MGVAGGHDAREVLEKAFEKLLPAFGYLHSSVAGFAASVVVFSAWLLRKYMGDTQKVMMRLEDNLALMVSLREKIRRKEEDLALLESALAKAGSDLERRMIRRRIESLRAELERLYDEYDLLDMKVAAIERLLELKEEGLVRKAEKVIEKIEKGEVDKDVYEVLRSLEERWRNRQLTKGVIEKLLQEG